MDSFKVEENYGNHCNECGKVKSGKPSILFTVNGVSYTLCEDCYKLFIGQLYLLKPSVFEELIVQLAKKDRSRILSLINKA